MNNMTKNNPKISIIVPCYNEERHIKDCLDSIIDDYVIDNAEILILDGMSTDNTRKIVEDYIKKYPDVIIKLINNEKRYQSYGINIGIDRAQGAIIMLIGTHAHYPKGYVRACVELLERTGADNVGGATYARGKTRFQKLVARAMRHPVGVGNAKFRLGNYKGFVDTVFPGTFRKSLFKKLGYFDPYIAEDAEFNLRILKSGGKIYLDSSIKIEYFPRDTLKGLIKQYFNYGKGRCRTTLKHRQFTSWRQLAPIVLVLGLVGSLLLTFFNPLFLFPWIAYLFSLFFASWITLRREKGRIGDVFLLTVIFMSMHVSYGCGFLMRLLRLVK